MPSGRKQNFSQKAKIILEKEQKPFLRKLSSESNSFFRKENSLAKTIYSLEAAIFGKSIFEIYILF